MNSLEGGRGEERRAFHLLLIALERQGKKGRRTKEGERRREGKGRSP